MTKPDPMTFSDLMRQQLDAQRGFELIEQEIAECEAESRRAGDADAQILMRLKTRRLRKALSLLRDVARPAVPELDDGLHARLRDADACVERALGSLFLFRKEWDAGFALDFETHCGKLHEASGAILDHLETEGFQ